MIVILCQSHSLHSICVQLAKPCDASVVCSASSSLCCTGTAAWITVPEWWHQLRVRASTDGINCKGRVEAACACVQEAVILKASLGPLRRLSFLRLDLLYHQKSLPITKNDIQMKEKFLECTLFGLGQFERLVSLEIIASDAAVFLNRYPPPPPPPPSGAGPPYLSIRFSYHFVPSGSVSGLR